VSIFNEYSCDNCGSNEMIEIPNIGLYTDGNPIHVCKKCALVMSRYRRSAEELAKLWDDEYV